MMILISRPELSCPALMDTETETMVRLLDQGLERLHLRKPGARLTDLRRLVENLSSAQKSRLAIHPPREVFEQLGMAKALPEVCSWMQAANLSHLHVPAWLRCCPQYSEKRMMQLLIEFELTASTSIHFAKELDNLDNTNNSQRRCAYRYLLVSPLFESISKPGYQANAALWQLPAQQKKRARGLCPLIGMGGIDAKNIHQVLSAGFNGVALLGAIWPVLNPASGKEWTRTVLDNFKQIRIPEDPKILKN